MLLKFQAGGDETSDQHSCGGGGEKQFDLRDTWKVKLRKLWMDCFL